MPTINVSDSDFEVVAGAAVDAQSRGQAEDAKALDKIARKINASLTISQNRQRGVGTHGPNTPFRWTDAPSVLLPELTPRNQQDGEG